MLFFFQAQGLPCIFQYLGGERGLCLCPELYDTNLDLFFGQDIAALDMNQHGTAFKAQSLDFLYLHAPFCFRRDESWEAISSCS